MQLPIPSGTVLQSRYRLMQLLGQGGFGRTYLAEDLNRFEEKCAIKEFNPLQGEDRFSDKATQLFQREAAILYQIQHPQIPQFRATFEEDQRLFLVQDYVDGTTYRDLLETRRQNNTAFSETEVRQFLQQILPVLAHIHGKGIIHRDITPDNIIQRRADQQPVLIDFGVVKEVVTRIQLPDTTAQATTVGKLGYAPSEQMQTGRAYPNSDLYSLAVTAIVLLTGKEPQDLFDDVNLAWHWTQYASVSPSLAQVLTKALNYRPGDRYQSVSEMAQALGAVGTKAPTAAAPPPSQMRTVAVGRAYEPTQQAPATVRRPAPPPPPPSSDSIWENPWAITAMGTGLALVAGIGGWALVNALNAPPTPPPVTEAPVTEPPPPEPDPTPPPAPEPTEPDPVEFSQQVSLSAGEEQVVEGTLQSHETINYIIQGQQGQTLTVSMGGEGVLLTVLAPNGQPAGSGAERTIRWQGTLDFSGPYRVQLRPVQGLPQSDYRLTLRLSQPETAEPEEPESPPEPEDDSPEENQPNIQEQRVQFPAGGTSVLVSNEVGPDRIRRYLVNARQGQILSAELSGLSGPATLSVRTPDRALVDDAARLLSWQGELQTGGDYLIDVSAPSRAAYTLRIAVR